jgi:Leucine-rich repeat (LRR) protein
MSHDRQVLDRIRAEIGRDPLLQFEGDTCVSLSLWDESEPFAGLIRHHDSAAQQRVLLDIAQLRGLRTLDIHQNWLRSLPAELGGLQELRSLNVTSNYLGTLPDWIWGLKNLEFLSVGVNNLEAVSPRVGELQNLQALYLHKNRIREVPREVLQLKGLKTLSLYLNAVPEFPTWVTELPEIEMFSWGISGITRFPREIAAWKKLKYLTVVSCQFDNLEGIEECSSLLGTRLHKNKVKQLPRDWSRMKLLRQLTLYQNQLSELPESMAGMDQLQMLNIAWNGFRHLPTWLPQLRNLVWLSTHHNDWADPSEFDRLPAKVRVVREHPFGWQPAPMWNKLDYT